jgi:pyridoxamine 5'-phosphate oxidase-like protein
MARWAELESAAPEVARRARELLDAHRFLLLGTIRRDGTPRISPVEARVVRGELVLALIPRSLKARDLLRDPRLVLNAPVLHPDDPNEELKLRGRAVVVQEEALRAAAADAIEAGSGWRPGAGWHVLAIDVDDAAHMAWSGGELRMTRWTPAGGVERLRRRVPG